MAQQTGHIFGGKMFGLAVREFKILLGVILVTIYVAAMIYKWRNG